ncbi:hypothetical protein [Arthrobacter luteolus]|uniref:hypothetical protein n=1 Tax=Arthrobacter luteolus TaxID=98672 RepID=UPI0012ECFA94|nr:hypothetical protein [Arthrobacter luteolus]
MADLLAAASRFEYTPFDATHTVILEQDAGFRAAVYRWGLETQEMTFLGELDRASHVLTAGSLAAIDKSSNASDRGLCISTVQEMVSALTEFGLAWYAPDKGDRERSGRRLTATINRLRKRLAAVLDDGPLATDTPAL